MAGWGGLPTPNLFPFSPHKESSFLKGSPSARGVNPVMFIPPVVLRGEDMRVYVDAGLVGLRVRSSEDCSLFRTGNPWIVPELE